MLAAKHWTCDASRNEGLASLINFRLEHLFYRAAACLTYLACPNLVEALPAANDGAYSNMTSVLQLHLWQNKSSSALANQFEVGTTQSTRHANEATVSFGNQHEVSPVFYPTNQLKTLLNGVTSRLFEIERLVGASHHSIFSLDAPWNLTESDEANQSIHSNMPCVGCRRKWKEVCEVERQLLWLAEHGTKTRRQQNRKSGGGGKKSGASTASKKKKTSGKPKATASSIGTKSTRQAHQQASKGGVDMEEDDVEETEFDSGSVEEEEDEDDGENSELYDSSTEDDQYNSNDEDEEEEDDNEALDMDDSPNDASEAAGGGDLANEDNDDEEDEEEDDDNNFMHHHQQQDATFDDEDDAEWDA